MIRQCFTILLLSVVTQSAHADWASWWRTPEQQAKSAYEKGDVDQLNIIAPDNTWKGVAAHETGEYEEAARLFNEESEQLRLDGNQDAANRTLYNRGVSEVRAGQYQNAVETFDQVLEQNPDFADAQHNRDIAQQLVQQQAQEQQKQQSGDDQNESSDQSEQSGEQSDSSGSDEQPSDEQGNEQSEPGEAGEQDPDSSEGQQADGSDASQAESEASQQEAEQAARDALEAEAQAGQEPDDEGEENNGESGTVQAEQPMSESEQATEQWLRRIPDDPSGLLRRKLEQSHRTEFPEVRDAPEPW